MVRSMRQVFGNRVPGFYLSTGALLEGCLE